ncbi:MAG: NUDIX domain-containing protein [Candidatus Paceibacterota bacterium]
MNDQIPRVGVGVMIFKDGKILLTKRKGAHGAGEYSFPGGHLEYMESFEECARRETREEAGIEIQNLRFSYVTNSKKYTPKHYIHIGLIADWKSGEPKIMEPEKSEEWKWYDLDNLPEPLFEFSEFAVEAYKNGENYIKLFE